MNTEKPAYHHIPRGELVAFLRKEHTKETQALQTDPHMLTEKTMRVRGRLSFVVAALLLHEDDIFQKNETIVKAPFQANGEKSDYLYLERKLVTVPSLPPMLLYVVSYLMCVAENEYDVWSEQYFITFEDAHDCFNKRKAAHLPRMGVEHAQEYFVNEEHRMHAALYRLTHDKETRLL